MHEALSLTSSTVNKTKLQQQQTNPIRKKRKGRRILQEWYRVRLTNT
jgi:hypothetical protein